MRAVPDAALGLVRRFEGFSARPYRCPAGFLTVGYGHRCADGQPAIDRAEGERMLALDMGRAGAAVLRLVRAPLDDGQYGALASFVFNLGPGALQASTLRRRLDAGDVPGAASEFRRWVHAGGRSLAGLVLRRAAERAMFLGLRS